MDLKAIEARLEEGLKARGKAVVNRNAVSALFGAFSDPVGSLGKIFLGRQDALDAEAARLKQDVIVELLCKIDDALSGASHAATSSEVVIEGLIEASGHQADEVVGVSIESGGENVRFAAGARVSASGQDVKSVTGVRIGGTR
ncbi:hypothetical protein [Variovorax sp. DAIF25]|uniref:hypothetical protein n=1 Tax=Variovorax sp. DAIF25 TaxID=3080983 RepID=UPI003D6BF40E